MKAVIHWSDQGKCPTCGHALKALGEEWVVFNQLVHDKGKDGKSTHRLLLSDLAAVYSLGKATHLVVRGSTKETIVDGSLKTILEKYPNHLVQISRSCAVQAAMITDLLPDAFRADSTYIVRLSDGHEFRMSRRRTKFLREVLGRGAYKIMRRPQSSTKVEPHVHVDV